MCGIFGQFRRDGKTLDNDILCRLTNSLRHRGPDGGAYWSDAPFFLGHRRLSIIDLAQGQQPMATADGQLIVTFNGEIYNYVELRQELIARGHVFRTASDTEVLLHGYREWHVNLPSHLVGMFAFAIANREHRTLFLARDRFGEKPLLYHETPSSVTFASELRALASLPNLQAEVDLEALAPYLCLNYVPGDRTLLQGIKRLPPATWRLYTQEDTKEGIYWFPPQPKTIQASLRLDDALKQLREKLDQSVSISLRSDVPIALFLSGGIDSSVVAESAMRQGSLSKAYCLDFAEASFSEWDKAQSVAQRLGLPLQRVVLSPQVLSDFLSIVAHADDPLADSSAVAVWTLAKEVGRDHKVIISGDGGDELFAGYLTYQATAWHNLFVSHLPTKTRSLMVALANKLPSSNAKVSMGYKLMRFLRAADLPASEAHFTWNGTWLPKDAANLLQSETAKQLAITSMSDLTARHGLEDRPNLLKLQCADINDYLPNDILTKVDRMTMAHGVEARAPLLVPLVAEFALSLPDSLKIKPFSQPKIILRELAHQIYGTQISKAKKQGFSIPIHIWLRGPARELVEELLSRQSLESIGLFDINAVLQAKEQHMNGKKLLGFELWGLMVFVAWYRARVVAAAIPPLIEQPLTRLDFG